MSGMDRLTDELLEAYASGKWKSYERDNIAMARELLAHRRASQAAPASVGFGIYGEYTPITVGAGTTVKTPAPSDALREALEPFAKAADIKLCGEWRDDQSISRTDVAFSITFGDLRRARAALSASPAQEGDE